MPDRGPPGAGVVPLSPRARYDYYLVENTYVARYDRDAGLTERLLPDGTWVRSMATREVFDGRPLEDERDARETAAFLVARDKERATRPS